MIAVLSVDAPSHGYGYRKANYYRRLKQVSLWHEQITKLKGIALQRCTSSEYRREDRELWRLMAKLADTDFLTAIAEIPAPKGSRVDGHKIRIIEVILHGRKDLGKAGRVKGKDKD